MTEIAVIVDWFGPYESVKDAVRAANHELLDYLYVGFGYMGRTRRPGRGSFIYIGRCNGGSRVRHLQEDDATYTSIRLGRVASHQKSGPRATKTRMALNLAETAHIFALKPKINIRKLTGWPSETIFLLNRWWNTELDYSSVVKPFAGWPEIITSNPDDDVGYKVFLSGTKPKVQSFKRTSNPAAKSRPN